MSADHERVISTAILPTLDMEAAVAFYGDLGFTVDRFAADYALVIHHGHEVLHLAASDTRAQGIVYLNVSDVDGWHERCAQAGYSPGQVEDRSWGMREFSVLDPSGNTLRIGANR